MTARLTPSLTEDHEHDDIIYPDTIPFLLVHLACVAAFWTGETTEAVLLCIGLYVFRMFVVTAGYHRYFSHRSFKTSRVFQFILGLLAQTSAQRGILWWAAYHNNKLTRSFVALDQEDPRSPLSNLDRLSKSPIRAEYYLSEIIQKFIPQSPLFL